MIEVKIILLLASLICFALMLKLTFELKGIFRDIDRCFIRMDGKFAHMIDICNGANKMKKKLIKSKRRS